jgi:hypothetical protein
VLLVLHVSFLTLQGPRVTTICLVLKVLFHINTVYAQHSEWYFQWQYEKWSGSWNNIMQINWFLSVESPPNYHSTNPAPSASYLYYSCQKDKRAKRKDLQTNKTFLEVGKHWTEKYVYIVFCQCSEGRGVHFLKRKLELCVLLYWEWISQCYCHEIPTQHVTWNDAELARHETQHSRRRSPSQCHFFLPFHSVTVLQA